VREKLSVLLAFILIFAFSSVDNAVSPMVGRIAQTYGVGLEKVLWLISACTAGTVLGVFLGPWFTSRLKPGGLLLFTSGPDEGGAGGEMYGESFGYCSLSPTEYRKLLAGQGLEVLLHKAEDPACGGHTVWLAAGKAGPS